MGYLCISFQRSFDVFLFFFAFGLAFITFHHRQVVHVITALLAPCAARRCAVLHACGLLQVVFTDSMVALFSLPRTLIAYSGEFLLAYGVLVAWLSTRMPLPRPLVWLLIAGNLAWAAACMVLFFGGGVRLSALGMTYVAVQALTVVVLAELPYFGLRRQATSLAW